MDPFVARLPRATRLVAAASALLLPVVLGFTAVPAQAAVAPVGQGFTVTPSDLAFILKQIKVAERHADTFTPEDPCGTLVGPGPDQIPDVLTSYGLRTVDGSCNNLTPGREKYASADQPFPRYANPVFKDAEASPPAFGPPAATTYKQKRGFVFDSQPRMISNLITDQTSTNPAAVAAAGFPVRTQGNPGLVPCTTEPAPDGTGGVPENCVAKYKTLFIPNVTTDVGLSPPYNSMFTFFGQFFDHGLDQTLKSGGTVFVPLKDDDPLVAGPNHVFGDADDLAPNLRFMVLTRAQNQPGDDGIHGDDPATTTVDESADDTQDTNNADSPWVDQSQTYSSHSSHQVFLRKYANNTAGKPVSTGNLLGGTGAKLTAMPTWADVKTQAANLLGLKLVDKDALNVPMIATDPYGKFLPGLNGLPQYVTESGMVEGNLANPEPVPADVLHFDTPFLTDIAHNADPSPQDIDHNPATPKTDPSPDADGTASSDFANQPVGTYDDEMLDAHFAAGDGRVNENIALTAIHQVFHSEHERLVADIKNTLTTDTSAAGVEALKQWKLTTGAGGWNGERLFQAARFVTEMEYQHLAFEEFARKVQPAIKPFGEYEPDVNPAIHAEFAHAVYRFGHSMLDETVARTNEDGSDNSIPLLTAFLNPPEYYNGGSAGDLTPELAAGSIIMGASDQVDNELDEFVTETLRNNLLGLPLDLATLNLTRARETGVPSLNGFRRQIFGATNELAPYTDWSDFGQNLKHPESLINFVAAYGQHTTITSKSTLAGKRSAARAIVDPTPTDVPPADAADFMFGTGAYANTPAGVTTTGVDDIDLWVGGLAEMTNVNGGLLGSTFNYVFENQLTDLQDGDRLYYVGRTAGMNLGSQLEGNSFAELIQRNTEGTDSLKADVFATADCKFQLSNLNGTPAGFAASGATVANDPSTECDESKLLQRKADGTIQYRQTNTIDPPGVNGQSVYNGTGGIDRVSGGTDNDTFWGGAGKDVIDGGGGDDVSLGGDGNDIITDKSGGDDVLKGGPGNDALDGGLGLDLLFGGDGQDFINGGAGDNLSFGGPGDDFIIAGQGADGVLGDGGDDWIQGGAGEDVLSGDHGAPFLDDPAQTKPGNDTFIGQGGGDTYNAEGGDDVMSSNTAIDAFTGAAGFDWAIHQYDTGGASDDMLINNNLIGHTLPQVVNRDSWQETEAVSGSAFDDVIRGDDATPSTVGGAGLTGCDVLDQAGVDRISGLGQLLPQPLTGELAPVVAKSATGFCPLDGPIWGEGNILLGGAGNDTIEGRGGDDIIDGDKSLSVRISVRTNPADPLTQIGTTDLMEKVATSGHFGPGTAGMTLQAAVFAGLVDPGSLVAVREILDGPGGTDTAVFSDFPENYTVTTTGGTGVMGSAGATTTVAHLGGAGPDGTDTIRNIEMLQFNTNAPVAVLSINGSTGLTAKASLNGGSPMFDMSGSSAAPGATIESGSLDYGDGTPAESFAGDPADWNPDHPYDTVGHKVVTLQVKDSAGITSAPVTVTILVHPQPTVTITVPGPVRPGAPVTFDVTTSTPSDTVFNEFYDVDYGDGDGTEFPDGVPPATLTHTYDTAGTYTVTLTVYNDADGWGSASTEVVVDGIPPEPVTALSASTVTPSSITLAWTNPADEDFTGVTIRRIAGATAPTLETGTLVINTAAGVTSYTDNGLTPGTQYSYAVFAHDGAPNHATAVTVTARTTTRISDFNNDGRADLVARDSVGTLWFYPGSGDGGFNGRKVMRGGNWNVFTSIVSPGDVTGDGVGDVLARDAAGQLYLYTGNGAGGFTGLRVIGAKWNVMTAITGAGDMTGDGHNDILARDTSGNLWLYPMTGNGAFQPRRLIGTGWNVMTAITGPGDFSGDNRADILARDNVGQLWLYRGNGAGAVSSRTRVGTGWQVMTALVTPGNWDRSAGNDVIARDGAGTLWLYRGNNAGQLPSRLKIGSGWNGYTIA